MLSLPPDISKKWIRERVSDEEIFERYIGRPVTFREKFCSPLREDRNPTCNFFISRNGVLWLKDHSGHFAGNCYDLVMFMYSASFAEALLIVARDFMLLDVDFDKEFKIPKHKDYVQQKAKIQVKTRNWSDSDDSFWSKFGIDHILLRYFGVYPVQHLWLDNKLHYSYNKNDPSYLYYFDKENVKIYFPLRKNARFLCNTNALQGYDQLPDEGNVLIITKSLKDVMVLYNFGIHAVAPQSETQSITDEQYAEFCERFDYIYSLYDFDLTGVRTANKMKREYGIEPLLFTNGRFSSFDYGAKDVSDLYALLANKERDSQVKGGDRGISGTSEELQCDTDIHAERIRTIKREIKAIREI